MEAACQTSSFSLLTLSSSLLSIPYELKKFWRHFNDLNKLGHQSCFIMPKSVLITVHLFLIIIGLRVDNSLVLLFSLHESCTVSDRQVIPKLETA